MAHITNKEEYIARINQLLGPNHTAMDLNGNIPVYKTLHDECGAGGFSDADIAATLNEYYQLSGIFTMTAEKLQAIREQHNF